MRSRAHGFALAALLLKAVVSEAAVSEVSVSAAATPAPDPSKALSQYVHMVWTPQHGLPSIEVQGIHQTRDGYLWVTSRNGLARFDGARFEVFNSETTPVFKSERFDQLVEAPNGDLWVGTHGGGVYRYRDGRFERLSTDNPAHDEIRSMLIDRQGEFWLGTLDGLLRLENGVFEPHFVPELAGKIISALFQDPDGSLWIGVSQESVGRLEGRRYEARFRFDGGEASDLVGSSAVAFHRDPDGTFWIGTDGGLHRIRDGNITVLGQDQGLAGDQISALLLDGAGSLWIGGEFGLSRVRGNHLDTIELSTDNRGLERTYRATSLFVDRDGGLWVGTYGHGLHHFRDGPITPFSMAEGLTENVTVSVFESRSGGLLVAGQRGSLNRIKGKQIEHVWSAEEVPFDHIWTLVEDPGERFLVGTSNGLFRYEKGAFRHWDSIRGLPHAWPRVIYRDPEDEHAFFIGTFGGGVARLSGDELEPFVGPDRLSDGRVRSLLKDRHGAFWVGTEMGLNRLQNGRLEIFTTRDGLGSNAIRPLYEDEEGDLWIGSAGGGLTRYRNGVFTSYSRFAGLPQGDVWALQEDNHRNLWWSTDDGILRVHKDAFETYDSGLLDALPIRSYGVRDGMKHVEGNGHGYPSSWRDANGFLWMISTAGVNRIDPLTRNLTAPPIRVESLLAGGRLVDLGGEVRLSHQQRDLEIRYTALSFANPEGLRFKYRLDGYDQHWHEAGARRVAYYTNLPQGRYTFRVEAINEDGIGSEASALTELHVLPPPWQSGWAYTGYVLLSILTAAGAMRLHRRRLARERELRRREAERDRRIIERLTEVDRLKDEFLANTSHELRTPLHGMMGLAESLIAGSHGNLNEDVVADLSLIVNSSVRLNQLVGDILDFSKLRHKSLELHLGPVDLKAVADVVVTLLSNSAEAKNLLLENRISADLPLAWADENRLQQILHNLIGNAVKFTDEGSVEVAAEHSDGELVLRVSDTGIGIPLADQSRIFSAFEQMDATVARTQAGSGLGLAITSRLVDLHGGRLWVESAPGKGAHFLFTLPKAGFDVDLSRELADEVSHLPEPALDRAAGPVEETVTELLPSASGETARILVVDDEPINLHTIANFLSMEGFHLTMASNGEDALELLENEAFDLVVLDVMMPKVSGYEVCRAIRQDHALEELPVLFLSAMERSKDRVAGLEEGANDYLTKPVRRAELVARVRIQLELVAAHRLRTEEIEGLRGMLPLCANCKKIRDDQGYWTLLEKYIETHSGARVTHGICPECTRELYPDLDQPHSD